MTEIVGEVVVQALDEVLKDVEYINRRLKALPKLTGLVTGQSKDAADAASNRKAKHPIAEQGALLGVRIFACLHVLHPLILANLSPGKALERLLALLRRIYAAISNLVKLHINHALKWVPDELHELLELLAEDQRGELSLNANVADLINHVHSSAANQAQVKRQGNLIPSLVFEVWPLVACTCVAIREQSLMRRFSLPHRWSSLICSW